MFRVEHNVPDVYINKSRDFQLISRLYDLVFQSSRFSIDSMKYTADTLRCLDQMLPALSSKIGFFEDLQLHDREYRFLLSAFPHIIRYKGSKQGFIYILNLFSRMTGARLDIDPVQESPSKITIRLRNIRKINTDLLQSLIEYVRPVGLIVDYEIVLATDTQEDIVFKDSANLSKIAFPEEGDRGVVTKDERSIKDVQSTIGFVLVDDGTNNTIS